MTQFSNLLPTTGAPTTTIFSNDIQTESLQTFIDSVTNGDPNTVVGVYIPQTIALPVAQQPAGNAGFVTRQPELTTQFQLAEQYGTIGILAHNDLAGAQFSNIQMGHYAVVIYGDGREEYFLIEEIEKYQALSPTSTYSDFRNLENNEKMTASQLFSHIYGPGDRLVFQTCMDAEGNPSWGRMFIIGKPVSPQVISFIQEASQVFNRTVYP